MSRPADRRGRAADRSGFTLVEVLVAFVVMAAMLGVLYRDVVQTRTAAVRFGARSGDEVVAQALLAEFRARRDLRDGHYSGTRDGREWSLEARAVDLAAQLPAPAPEPAAANGTAARQPPKSALWTLQRLVLRVSTGGRPLEAETIRLAKAPAPAGDRP